jgi:hypothetical protein
LFADLALRLVSCGVSEADAEGISSIQENISSLHGTRFGIRTMDARLRNAIILPRRRPGQDEVSWQAAIVLLGSRKTVPMHHSKTCMQSLMMILTLNEREKYVINIV